MAAIDEKRVTQATDVKEKKAGSIPQYEVNGILTFRGPILFDGMKAAGLAGLGRHYPAGPVVFFPEEHPDVPNDDCNKYQVHYEKIGEVTDATLKARLIRAAVEAGFFSDPSDIPASFLGRWRLTPCADYYPAHINFGEIIYDATEQERKRLLAGGVALPLAPSHDQDIPKLSQSPG